VRTAAAWSFTPTDRDKAGGSALRLAHWFGNTPEFWMTLQARHDLSLAERQAGKEINALPTRAKKHRQQREEQARAA
jgi:antitoxin HigA-1